MSWPNGKSWKAWPRTSRRSPIFLIRWGCSCNSSAKLPDLRHHCKDIAARRDEISHVKLELFELDSNRSDLADTDPEVAADADPEVAAVMNAIAAIPSDIDRQELKSTVRNC